jgi:hypothetical protein
MNLATFSFRFRLAFASGALALTAGLFAVGCGSEASGSPTSEGVEQGTQAHTNVLPPINAEDRTYPPHGYPCLGCAPCGPSYCDIVSNKVVYHAGGTSSIIEQAEAASEETSVKPPINEADRTYPPHGYPCLGCAPCGNSYCDIVSNKVVYHAGGTSSIIEQAEAASEETSVKPPINEADRTYPPHGYPCLGCAPCGTSYCDIVSNKVVYHAPLKSSIEQAEGSSAAQSE